MQPLFSSARQVWIYRCCNFVGRVTQTEDGILNCALVFYHYASLALEVKDTVAEGNGSRVCRCWKIMLLHFHSNGQSKYTFEALHHQVQLATFPPPVAHQLKWGLFVNTHGGQGRDIFCNLHNEHLIKLF